MAVSGTPPSFAQAWKDTLDEAGIDDATKAYLVARSIGRIGTVALLAKDTDDFHSKVTDKFLTGDTIAGFEHKAAGNNDVLRACMAHLFEECCLLYSASRQPPPAVQGSVQQAPAAPSAVNNTKVPKELPAGVWNQQLSRYNQITVGGQSRRFPEAMLIGAESVLARVWWEHTSSKMYSPIKLGEIISKRSFTAMGDVNYLATARQEKTARTLVLTAEDTIGTADDDIFDPRSSWAVSDALESIKWAFIFIDLGSETSIDTWFLHFSKLIRTRPRFLDAIRAYWDTASWRICMDMRSGITFEAATAAVLVDIVWQHEHLFSKMLSSGKGHKPDDHNKGDERPSKRARTSSKGSNKGQMNEGKGGKNKGAQNDVCRKFNMGTCQNTSCRYQHVCSTCYKPGHTTSQCWHKDAPPTTKGKGKGKRGKKDGKRSDPQQQQQGAGAPPS